MTLLAMRSRRIGGRRVLDRHMSTNASWDYNRVGTIACKGKATAGEPRGVERNGSRRRHQGPYEMPYMHNYKPHTVERLMPLHLSARDGNIAEGGGDFSWLCDMINESRVNNMMVQ